MKITSITKIPLIKSPIPNPELAKRNVKVAMGRIVVAGEKEFDYKGYHIRIEEDIEPDEVSKKWFYVSKDGMEITANIGPYEPDNTVFLWIDANCPSNPPHGNWDRKNLTKYIEERDQYYQNVFAKTKQIIKIAERFKKVVANKKVEAQNPVNMGAEINNGVQSAPVAPTGQQAEQLSLNPNQDSSPMKDMITPQNFNKTISPEEKKQLMLSINKLKVSFPQLGNVLKGPQAKQYLTMFLE
jgi:hypothetical protein